MQEKYASIGALNSVKILVELFHISVPEACKRFTELCEGIIIQDAGYHKNMTSTGVRRESQSHLQQRGLKQFKQISR